MDSNFIEGSTARAQQTSNPSGTSPVGPVGINATQIQKLLPAVILAVGIGLILLTINLMSSGRLSQNGKGAGEAHAVAEDLTPEQMAAVQQALQNENDATTGDLPNDTN